MQSVADFFERHLASLQNTPLLDGYDHYSIVCDIEFKDLNQIWQIEILGGCIRSINQRSNEGLPATVQFELNEPVFWNIIQGEISAQTAFFKRQTQIRGDLFQGMKLAKILSLFFAKYPYQKPT